MQVITILWGDPATGMLTLSDNGHTRAKRRETIIWLIANGSGVKFISNIYPKTAIPTPFFSEMPHRVGSSPNWKAVIHADVDVVSKYNYSISWMPEGSNDIKEHDPIISINPTYPFIKILTPLVTAVAFALFVSLFLSKKKKKKKKSSPISQ